MVYTDFIEELYVAEMFSGQIFIESKQILIPCINIGVSEHPLNPEKDLKYIDFSYLFFDEVISLEFNKIYTQIEDILENTFFMDTYDILKNDSYQIEIRCKRISFIPSEKYRISKKMWTPIKTPNFKPNLIYNDVHKFVNTPISTILM